MVAADYTRLCTEGEGLCVETIFRLKNHNHTDRKDSINMQTNDENKLNQNKLTHKKEAILGTFLTIAGGKPGVKTAYTAVSTMKAQPNNLEKTLSLPGFMLLHTQ